MVEKKVLKNDPWNGFISFFEIPNYDGNRYWYASHRTEKMFFPRNGERKAYKLIW